MIEPSLMKKLSVIVFTLISVFVVAQKQEANQKSVLYTIPVVFHVLHQNGSENISNAQIEDAVRILNENFSLTNTSASTIHADFQGMQADAQIEFKLAKLAPNGDCFNGITRTYTPLSNMQGLYDQKIQSVISNNDVYSGIWSENHYLNIFVCSVDEGKATYSNFTGEPGMLNSAIFVYPYYVGSIGTGNSGSIKEFLTHEIGHWLGLQNTFGPELEFNSDYCSTDDGLVDTPNCSWEYACDLENTECGPRAMVENFMAQSYCMKFFTSDQVNLMHTNLNDTSTNRFALWQSSNLAVTGVSNLQELCAANFSVSNPFPCNGASVQFKDLSYPNVQLRLWSFPGGTPSSSTDQNPIIVYSVPGKHDVTLTVSDGENVFMITQPNAVEVTPSSAIDITYYEGFEHYTGLGNIDNFNVFNPDNNASFDITTLAAHTGNQCAVLRNYNDTLMSLDALISSKIDNTWLEAAPATMSFRYAFRRRENDTIQQFKLTGNGYCIWNSGSILKDLTNDLRSQPTVNEDWYPEVNDWNTVHIQLSYNSISATNFRYKFEFIGAGTNNLFIDDINIYQGLPSDDIVLGFDEIYLTAISHLQLYPNPSNSELNLDFILDTDQNVNLVFYDVIGNEVQKHFILGKQGSNSVMLDASELSKGIYFIKVRTLNFEKTLEFLKD